jgi:hypothetical protein
LDTDRERGHCEENVPPEVAGDGITGKDLGIEVG